MGWNGFERNKLDFILTDLLPVELSEHFSLVPFYNFLTQANQQNKLKMLTKNMRKECASDTQIMFSDRKWVSIPHKYSIQKNESSFREMSILQPLAALNLFLFLECHQKNFMNFFDAHHCFSIRYHRERKDLYYKIRSKKATRYFQRISKRIGRGVLQQTGGYFKIYPFDSINSFCSSRNWQMCNYKYKYFARVDYKSCFDSIYAHAYKWIIEHNVVDSKAAKSGNFFLTIDRILQNINGHSSNGVVVGPEFSRMLVEVLLQQIDSEVFYALAQAGLKLKSDYRIFRYVDDIFIFANSPQEREIIRSQYRDISRKYLLNLNELKYLECDTPVAFSGWIEKTRILADKIDSCFYTAQESEWKGQVKKDRIPLDRWKDEFIVLIKEYPQDRRTIISFLLSTLLNKFSISGDGIKLFNEAGTGKAMLFIEFSLFMYAFCPNFDNARKVISLIIFMDQEVEFSKKDGKENMKLQKAIDRYSFVFRRANLPDIIDWFILFDEYHIHLDSKTEDEIIAKAVKLDDPIIWANLLRYSHYYLPFFNEIKSKIEDIVDSHVERLIPGKEMEQPEFWYVLVFINCSLLDKCILRKIKKVISDIYGTSSQNDKAHNICITLICDYLQQTTSGGNHGFFNWNSGALLSKNISYRTFQRTLFRRYKSNRYGLYASID